MLCFPTHLRIATQLHHVLTNNNASGLFVLEVDEPDLTFDNNSSGLSVLRVDEPDLRNCATGRTDGNATLAAKNTVPA